jgi:multidrug transporter EmrE-like cation transporter
MSPALFYGLLMALIDAFMLSFIKAFDLGWIKDIGWFKGARLMIVPTIVYALQPWIFLEAMKFETLTVMNLLWDMTSDVLVTAVGLFYFGEQLSPRKMIGVVLSFIAMCLLGC